MIKQYVTLTQTQHGVLWEERGRYYKTLQLAKKAVMRDAKEIARSPASRGKVLTFLDIG
jgi:hypothetical protein